VRTPDRLSYAGTALRWHRGRTLLTLLAMGIGVAAVVVLTSLGDGARRYVSGEFASLGSHLLVILPGRNDTAGGPPAMLGVTPRDLTIADTVALLRSPAVKRVTPIVVGEAPVSWRGRERSVPVLGTTGDFVRIRRWQMARGRFLPDGDPERAEPVCVIGAKIRDELFGSSDPIGEWVRAGQYRFRVIGVLAAGGRSIGVDKEDLVMVPVASAQTMFNNPSLFRVLVEARSRESIQEARTDVLAILRERHQGEEDVTVITQDAVLATFDRILRALTYTVAGIAAISLLVAGILIMNVMLISVSQRTGEIGLLKALGAPGRQILQLFLIEALILSLMGAVIGYLIGNAGSWFIRYLYPSVPAYPPLWASVASILTAMGTGLGFGILPARRAARLDPVAALSRR